MIHINNWGKLFWKNGGTEFLRSSVSPKPLSKTFKMGIDTGI
jgi:hypothetical protein